jgi:hypothetical protein
MFDPNIKVRVIADFKYRDESYVVANSHLSFDIYDSMKIAELITLYNKNYEYRDHIELPSIDALPYHVREQLIDTYKLDKPVDSAEFLPISDKVDYEIGGDIYTPFGYSPYESDIEVDVKPIADNIVEVETYEPKFVDPIKASVAEDKTVEPVKLIEEEDKQYESDTESENKIIKESQIIYSSLTTTILSLNKDELEDRSASDIKKAVLEINPSYDYTNKVEAIKYLLTLK